MSTSTAIALYDPADNAANRPALRTDRRYRAGIVMELLEVRRVLSAAVNAAVLDLGAPDDSAIVVDDCPTNDATTTDGVVAEGGSDGGVDGASGAGELTIMDLNVGATDGAVDATDAGNGFEWPEGWAWTLDRDPTQADVDALDAGDDTNWVPVRNFGGLTSGDPVDQGWYADGTYDGGGGGSGGGQDAGDPNDTPPADDAGGPDIIADFGDAGDVLVDSKPIPCVFVGNLDVPTLVHVPEDTVYFPGNLNVRTLGEIIQDWPSGYAWTLDTPPTQADADAFAAGNTAGWVNLDDLGPVDGVDVDLLLWNADDNYPWTLDSDGSYDDNGAYVQWPYGFAWNQDRAPTHDDVEAFEAGDQTGWIKIADALGISDQVWDDYNARWARTWEWWHPWDEINTVTGQRSWVYLASTGTLASVEFDADHAPDTGSRDVVESPAPTGDSPKPSFGGAPQPAAALAFGDDQAGSILLGKLKKSVTDDDPSDLPFMN